MGGPSGPGVAALIDSQNVEALSKEPLVVPAAETMLVNAMEKCLPLLEALAGEADGPMGLVVLASVLLQRMLSKPWPENAPQLCPGPPGCRRRRQ